MSNITLAHLRKNMCKWPIGDPLKNDFHFCGSKCGGEHPYCSEHTRIAYKKDTRGRKSI